MGVLGIDTIAIVVSDRHKAIRWYRDVLGLDVAYIGPRISNVDPSVQGTPDDAGHWIEMGPLRPRTRVHVCQMDEMEPGPTGITFLTDDILADYERMRKPPARPRVKRARRARASPAGGRGRRTRRPHRTVPVW